MMKKQINPEKFKSDLKKLRVLLILLTSIVAVYLIIIFADFRWSTNPDFAFKAQWYIWIFHNLILALFIWFNWKRMPIDKKHKTNNTFMLLFLGVIGMWLWLPNKGEVNKLVEKINCTKN